MSASGQCPQRALPLLLFPENAKRWLNLLAAAAALACAALPPLAAAVTIVTSPGSEGVSIGSTRTLTPTIQVAEGSPAPTFQWYRDNRPLHGETALSLVIQNVQPADAGGYTLAVTSGGMTVFTEPAFLGVSLESTQKVWGDAYEFRADIQHPNGNWYDQILMTGPAAAVRADPGQVTRTSFIDLNDDIVQVEFSGAGTLTIILQSSTAAAFPAKYNQELAYIKGHAAMTVTGADETTNVTIFSVGRMTAFDPTGGYDLSKPPSESNHPTLNQNPLFKTGADYDGVADVALLNIASPAGSFGGVRAANARFYAVTGNTGLLAPKVNFTGPVYVHDVAAYDTATPFLVTGGIATGEIRITGGNLEQPNAKPVTIAEAPSVSMETGTSSHGELLPALENAGQIIRNGETVTGQVVTPPAVRPQSNAQTGFRVRSDFAATLNSTDGWAGALNENVTIVADRPFRIRFEVEWKSILGGARQFRLQYRRNEVSWTDVEVQDFPHPESATPRVSIVSCAGFTDGAPTENILDGSPARFTAGAGISLAGQTSSWAGNGTHGEFEWAVVVRLFADGPVTNAAGDTFEFRMVEDDGEPMDAYVNPALPLTIPAGHVGGTFVETPGRIGPWQASNGDLYFIMEPTETNNAFMMMKSTDEGRTWREVDGANRPPTRDLESVDSRLIGATIHIIHQVTQSARYHSFRTSDHPTHPDTWDVRGELAGTVTAVAQTASMAVRSDGSIVAFYLGQEKIHYSIRSPAGVWSQVMTLDAGLAPNQAGPQAILGANDVIHLAYYGTDGTIWYRRFLADGTLTARQQLATGAGTSRSEYGAVLPLLYHSATNTVIIVYRLTNGKLWERRIVNHGEPTAAVQVSDRNVVRNAVDSQQPAADAVLDGQTVHVLFVEQSSRSLFSTRDDGGWQPSTLQVANILGSWVRGNVYTRRDGVRVYGYIYDAGSDGGSGMNRFAEIVLGTP